MTRRIALAVSFIFVVSLAFPSLTDAKDPESFDKLRNSLTWGGYYEFEYEDVEQGNGSSPNGDFDQHRNILFFGAQPHERIRFFNELEIEHGGNDASGAADFKFEQAWLDFELTENHTFRGGIDLIPLGRMNVNHDGNLRDFVFRPQVDKQLIPTTWFESGVGFHGNITDRLSYHIGVSNGIRASSPTDTGTVGEFESMLDADLDESDANGSKAGWGRLVFSPQLGLDIGVSGYKTRYDATNSADSDIRFLALDFHYVPQSYSNWEFKGEYVDIDKDQQGTGLSDGSGGYLEVAYHFFPDDWRDAWFAKGFDNPTFTALARHEELEFDEDPANPTSPAENDYSWTSIGLNYRPMERMAFKASYDFDDEDRAGRDDQDRVGFGMVLGY